MDGERSVFSLSDATLKSLTYGLTLSSLRDWRKLGGHVGFSATILRLLEQHQRSDKAMLLLEVWEGTGRSSLRKLILALYQADIPGSVKVLKDSELQGT